MCVSIDRYQPVCTGFDIGPIRYTESTIGPVHRYEPVVKTLGWTDIYFELPKRRIDEQLCMRFKMLDCEIFDLTMSIYR